MDLQAAAAHLRAGHLVALPTETVYGLAADADQPEAVARIFQAKGRPADHPLIVHVAGGTPEALRAQVDHYAAEVPAFARTLMERFWPGPLTLILPRRPGVADAAAGGAGNPTIGLRCPAHPVAQALLQACQAQGVYGLAAPSANRFGRVSPTSAAHVHDELGHVPDLLILDGGDCPVGIESTIVDASRSLPVLLRPGMVSQQALEAALGMPVALPDAAAPRVSGSLESHYAPHAQVRLMPAAQIQTALDLLGADARHIAVYSRQVVQPRSPHVRVRRMPDDAEACARQLFAVLRELDQPDTRVIWVETPPQEGLWAGVADRLARAAA